MATINDYIWSILTPAQHKMVSQFVLAGNTGGKTLRTTPATATRSATRTTTKKTAPRSRTAKPTLQTLIDFYATNPGGWSLSDLAAKTSIKPNILGRVLNSKNSPFRKNGDLWVMNRGATVSRKLTQALKAA